MLLWVSGSMDPQTHVRDEDAYVLQAEMFASGQWSAPAPSYPEFFEQAHVLVTPVVASKYPPGHSLLLSIGVFLGLPGLIPILLTAIGGGLLFSLAKRLTDQSVALVTWFLWMNWEANLEWRSSYFSELSTTTMWLAIWVLTFSWRQNGRRSQLLGIAVLVGFSAVTRPLTTLALTIPLSVVVLQNFGRGGRYRDIALPLVAGSVVLLILPLWSYFTLGSFSETPLGLYTSQYVPWDKLGFGLDSTAPQRLLPPDISNSFDYFLPIHATYSASTAALALVTRVIVVLLGVGGLWKLVFVPFVILGFARGARLSRFLRWSVTGMFVAYLAYAHHPNWSLYYLEILPLLCLFGAWELRRFWTIVENNWSTLHNHRYAGQMVLWIAAITVTMFTLRDTHDNVAKLREPVSMFWSALEKLPGDRVGVFIRYADDYKSGYSYQRNVVDPESSRIVTVLDRGAENYLITDALPDRQWYRILAPEFAVCRLAGQQAVSGGHGVPMIPQCPPDS